MDGYDFVRTVTRGEAREARAGTPEATSAASHGPSFYPKHEYESPSWGMSIDLDLCIGCNACVVACEAENNIPMVGKEQVAQGREMHWLRVDRYHEGDRAGPATCLPASSLHALREGAVRDGLPGDATMHSPDGLNQQVYNRCIGTRTCSSYCPYKVRRFNWFDYAGKDPPELQAARNPDVTVRGSRRHGEVHLLRPAHQRRARSRPKVDGRPIRDGEVVTACQQACPTQAIVFGDVMDPAAP